jgi:RNA polymerase sigma factor (sigma-70 family)
MKTVNSRTLLSAYARDGSEGAFRELVERYVNLVYATALRLSDGNNPFAEDVAQTVFIDLARKARDLSDQVMLGGWLHRRTCHVAATMLRSERRRRDRERKAMENPAQDHTQTNLARLAPILDEAINQLNAEDRAAIVLRFFEQRDFREVGQALNTSEDAARMRVNRALNKLHAHLARQGVTLGAGALASTLAAEGITAAPAGLAASIAGTALTSVALGGGVSSTLIKLLTVMKMKASIAGALAIATVTAFLIAQHQAHTYLALRQENRALRDQLEQTQQTTREQGLPLSEPASAQQLRDAQREVLRLRGEVGRLLRDLQAASAQSNGAALAADEENAPTNVISGFTPLQAAVRSQLAPGQSLVTGGWPGHPGARVFLLAVPQITGENPDRVEVHLATMEIPEMLLADFGLDGVQAGSSWSGASKVLPAGQAEELRKRFLDSPADTRPEHMRWIGEPHVTSTNSQPASSTVVMASWGDKGFLGASDDGKYGENLKLRCSDADLDLGPYNGPAFTVTPVILADRNTIDLAMQATVFWRFDDLTDR